MADGKGCSERACAMVRITKPEVLSGVFAVAGSREKMIVVNEKNENDRCCKCGHTRKDHRHGRGLCENDKGYPACCCRRFKSALKGPVVL
jgi:hypothetical protein